MYLFECTSFLVVLLHCRASGFKESKLCFFNKFTFFLFFVLIFNDVTRASLLECTFGNVLLPIAN